MNINLQDIPQVNELLSQYENARKVMEDSQSKLLQFGVTFDKPCNVKESKGPNELAYRAKFGIFLRISPRMRGEFNLRGDRESMAAEFLRLRESGCVIKIYGRYFRSSESESSEQREQPPIKENNNDAKKTASKTVEKVANAIKNNPKLAIQFDEYMSGLSLG